MYEREIIWELFHQVILETWQGGQGELSFFCWAQTLVWGEPCPELWGSAVIYKPLCVKPGRFQRGVSIAEVFSIAHFTPRGWSCSQSATVAVQSLKHFQRLPGLVGKRSISCAPCSCCRHWLEVVSPPFPGGLCVPWADVMSWSSSPVFHWTCCVSWTQVCVCCTQIPAGDQEVQWKTRAVGAGFREGGC